MGLKIFVVLMGVFFLFPIIIPTINSDVISLNSGGTGNIILNPNEFIEGFFSCVPQTCSDLNVECGNYVEQCGLTLDCGSCSSGFNCTAGSCVEDSVTPPDDGVGDAGVGVGVGVTTNFEVVPTSFNVNMVINTNVERTVSVKNIGSTILNLTLSQIDLETLIIFDQNYIELSVGETKDFKVIFVAPSNPGIYTGIIKVGSIQIPVSLNVKTKLLLFDSNIVVLNKDFLVSQGKDLETQVTLIPMGDKERLDVTLNYVIKDYRGKIYLTKSETLLVEEQVNFKRDFSTGALPLGKYIVGLELIYPNGVAPSSAHFEVTKRLPSDILGTLIFYLVILILIILILILLVLIIRYLRKLQEEEQGAASA